MENEGIAHCAMIEFRPQGGSTIFNFPFSILNFERISNGHFISRSPMGCAD